MDPIGLSGPNLFRTQHHRTLATKAYVNCANPDCLGEPRCSSWEICKSGTETNMEEDELFELLSRQLDSEAKFVQASTSPSPTIIRTKFCVNLHLQRATWKLSELGVVAFPPKLNKILHKNRSQKLACVRSLPGVRSYKRTFPSHQKEALSDILNKVPTYQ